MMKTKNHFYTITLTGKSNYCRYEAIFEGIKTTLRSLTRYQSPTRQELQQHYYLQAICKLIILIFFIIIGLHHACSRTL